MISAARTLPHVCALGNRSPAEYLDGATTGTTALRFFQRSAKSGACTNKLRQRRDVAERQILGEIEQRLLDPKLVMMMAREIEREYNRRTAVAERSSAEKPAALLELEARISRLKLRLRQGDPDTTSDEIGAAIERAEAKRAELMLPPRASQGATPVLSMLPKAAAMYRRLIGEGLDKHPEAAARARAAVRQLIAGGEIKLTPMTRKDGSPYLEASFGLQRIALLQAVPADHRVSGSGGRI